MRIRLAGREEDVDLASEILCVLGAVADVTTYPSDEDGFIRRYMAVEFSPETLEDLGVLLPPLAGR